MDAFLKVCLYLVLALLLIGANVVFVRSAYRTFVQRASVKSIAPFEVVGLGKDYDAAGHGIGLARLLRARLMRIQEEMSSLQGISTVLERSERGVAPQVQPAVARLDVPERIFEPVNLELEIAGLQVGGLLTRLQAAAAARDTLRFVVRYNNKLVTVAGDDGAGNFSIWLDEKERSDTQIVEQIAYALVHRQVAQRVREVSAFEIEEFQTLLNTLYELSQLNQRIAQGRPGGAEQFQAALKKLEPLVARAPRWRELVRVSAQTAELAGELERALTLYRQEQKLAPGQEPAQKIAELAELVAREDADVSAVETGGTAKVPTAGEKPSPARPAPTRSDQRIRELLGVRTTAMSRPLTIGVVGGPLLRAAIDARVRVLRGPGSDDRDMQEYATSVLQTARVIAPDAQYVFVPVSTQISISELVNAVTRLTEQDGVTVLLSTFGGGPPAPALRDAYRRALERNIVVVLAAGNDPSESAFGDVSKDQALVAGAVTLAGKRAAFSAEGNVWAPGVGIPLRAPLSGTRDGTTYSATLAAAVAARLLAERSMPPADVVRLLRDTSVKAPGGEAVLNLENALKARN